MDKDSGKTRKIDADARVRMYLLVGLHCMLLALRRRIHIYWLDFTVGYWH